MGLLKWLCPDKSESSGEQDKSSDSCSCNHHFFSSWEPSEVDSYIKHRHSIDMYAIVYPLGTRRGNKSVEKGNGFLSKYDADVKTMWANRVGNKYHVRVIKERHVRKCQAQKCKKREIAYIPIQYVAYYGSDPVCVVETEEELEEMLVKHDRKH